MYLRLGKNGRAKGVDFKIRFSKMLENDFNNNKESSRKLKKAQESSKLKIQHVT